MQRFPGLIQDNAGNSLALPTITVFTGTGTSTGSGGTLATIYSDNSRTALANPFTGNVDGTYEFYAQDGRYTVVPTKTLYAISTVPTSDAVLYDGPSLTVLNVKDYGAKGDGVTDDSLAIQTALNVARTTAETVFIPAGIYRIVTGLTTLGGQKIVGAGRPYTRLAYAGAGGSLLTIQAAGYLHTFISDLTLTNKGSGTTTAVDVSYTFVHLDRVTIGSGPVAGENAFTNGLRFNAIGGGRTFHNTVRDCYFNGNTAIGVLLSSTDYTYIEDCRFDNNPIGVQIITGVGNRITGGSIQGDFAVNGANWVGIDVVGDAGTGDATGTLIIGVGFELDRFGNAGASGAVAVRLGNGTGNALNTTIESNWINGVGVVGTTGIKVIATAKVGGLAIRDNRFNTITTGIAVPTGGLAELSLGRNTNTGVANMVTVNAIGTARNDYQALYGPSAPVVLGYQTPIRGGQSAASAVESRLIEFNTVNGQPSVYIAGDADITQFGGPIASKETTLPYSASITPTAGTGNTFIITATNGTAFTINAPTGSTNFQDIKFIIKNTSGGALGVITWNAVFKLAAFTSPATGFNRSITYHFDGTNWIEVARTTVDVPN